MTFQQLRYIVEISKCGSINKAAQKLFLSQSGISTAVRELEEELGIKFFVRSNRGVEFTPEGKEFLAMPSPCWSRSAGSRPIRRGTQRRGSGAFQRFLPAVSLYRGRVSWKCSSKSQENRYQYTLKETSMDGVIDDV